jgi:hypothetical protein
MTGLAEELREHIIRTYSDTPAGQRRASHWVMDPEWVSDVRRVDDDRRSAFCPPPVPVTGPELLMGLPMEIREGAGPPHLEQ